VKVFEPASTRVRELGITTEGRVMARMPRFAVMDLESTVELVVRGSPAGKDVSRGNCWDSLPGNGW
jgi:hypothetical protein